jgi:hypothetical protein
MKQEPVAWWMKANDPDYDKDYLTFDKPTRDQKVSHQGIELYTAPRELSDEEIWKWFEKNTVLAKESALMIARAILKKASEK